MTAYIQALDSQYTGWMCVHVQLILSDPLIVSHTQVDNLILAILKIRVTIFIRFNHTVIAPGTGREHSWRYE